MVGFWETLPNILISQFVEYFERHEHCFFVAKQPIKRQMVGHYAVVVRILAHSYEFLDFFGFCMEFAVSSIQFVADKGPVLLTNNF